MCYVVKGKVSNLKYRTKISAIEIGNKGDGMEASRNDHYDHDDKNVSETIASS